MMLVIVTWGLELVGFGGTENMFGKNYLNRVVILE